MIGCINNVRNTNYNKVFGFISCLYLKTTIIKTIINDNLSFINSFLYSSFD